MPKAPQVKFCENLTPGLQSPIMSIWTSDANTVPRVRFVKNVRIIVRFVHHSGVLCIYFE